MLTFAESKHPVFRSTSPLSRGVLKKQRWWKIVNTLIALTRERLKLFLAQLFLLISSVFTEQSQICVKDVTLVMIEQDDLLWKDNLTHCSCDDTYLCPMILDNKKKIQCKDIRNELKSYHNKKEWVHFVLMHRIPGHSWSRTVFHDERHWRIYTIHRFSGLSWVHFAKRWKIIWPERLDQREHQNWTALEVTTSYLQGKYGVEIRIESVNKDNSHSWVRISHGLNKLVTDLNNKEDDDNEQETSEMQFEDFALKTNVLAFASRSKAKATPRRRTSASSSTRTAPVCERSWTDVESGTYSHIAYPASKKLINLLRHGTSRSWWSDWILKIKRSSSEPFCAFSTLVWWKVEEQNGKRRRTQEKISILHWSIRTRNSLSPVFEVIQDAIRLILHYRTMYD